MRLAPYGSEWLYSMSPDRRKLVMTENARALFNFSAGVLGSQPSLLKFSSTSLVSVLLGEKSLLNAPLGLPFFAVDKAQCGKVGLNKCPSLG